VLSAGSHAGLPCAAQDILGTGLVTSEGALWNKQRTLISYALRVEILDDIVDIALRAVQRLVRLLVCYRLLASASRALIATRSVQSWRKFGALSSPSKFPKSFAISPCKLSGSPS